MSDDATKRIAGYAIAATITLAFPIIVVLEPYLKNLGTETKAIAWLIAVLGSAATYKTISTILWDLFNRSIFIRRLALGKMFLEGTWVGHYLRDDQHIVTVEFYSQEDGELRIAGNEIDSAGNTLSQWESFAASIDYRGDAVTYGYSCDIFGKGGAHDGIARFSLVRNGKTRASILDGYSADLTDGAKNPNYEHKISDYQIDRTEALRNAKRLYGF